MTASPPPGNKGSINGTGDGFPAGQCTYWASFRYHQLTGFYVPFSGNANQWASNAGVYAWAVSSTPVAPSIICLQAGVQLADGQDGHVGVVESINPDGSVNTSDLNWGLTATQRAQVSHVTFRPGPGVSFIYAVNGLNKPVTQNTGTFTGLGTVPNALINNFSLSPTADVPAFFVSLDTALLLTNPFSNIQALDPLTYMEELFANLVPDLTALVIRSFFIILGLLILYICVQEFVLKGINETLQPIGGISGVAKLVA